MMISEFINTVLNITDIKEQFITEVCLKTEYYNVVLKRLYIIDMEYTDDTLIFILNDGRTQEFRVTDDLECFTRKISIRWIPG